MDDKLFFGEFFFFFELVFIKYLESHGEKYVFVK